MNLLFTGRGGAGSWIVRGEQLGRACRGRVQPMASLSECLDAELIVAVKRIPAQLLDALRRSGRPWVFDAVDFYPQPECEKWDQKTSIDWAKQQIRALAPTAVIWPTKRMREDCDTGLPGIVLPHHHRPGIQPNPIREQVRTVGYEGRAAYLGGWEALLQRECMRRGWRFTSTPNSLSELDIVVAVRGDQWTSYAATHWKSNVKLANAHGSGTPFVGNAECGYMETATGCEFWVEKGNDLPAVFDRLTDVGQREQIAARFRSRAYSLEQAAADLKGFLQTCV